MNPATPLLRTARIDEAHCIGCTLCIQACPVDAIVGSAKLMHTVVAELCTGCELCLPPCPVDCIEMAQAPAELSVWTAERAEAAHARFDERKRRLARSRPARGRPAVVAVTTPPALTAAQRRVLIVEAVARVQARRARGARTPID